MEEHHFYYLCPRKTETRCSAVGSAPRSGRGGRWFKSSHLDKKQDALIISAFFV